MPAATTLPVPASRRATGRRTLGHPAADVRSTRPKRRATLLLATLAGLAGAGRAVPQAAAAPAAQVPSAEQQVAAALLAAPEDRRAGARVLGYDAQGAVVELRPGTNDLVCLADQPGDARFSVACYHASLEPYMRRGRELDAEGGSGEDRLARRWKEAEAGSLPMPKTPAALYVLSGTGFDAARGAVVDPYLRYVVYTPWATQESTGLPLTPPGPGGPWLMFPGTPGAHIMISPPRPSPPPPAAAPPAGGAAGNR